MSSASPENAAYKRLNDLMVAQYPAMAYMLADPDAFFADISARFDRQRQLTPENPRAFDFSDVGKPVLARMLAEVRAKQQEVQTLLRGVERRAANVIGRFAWWRAAKAREARIALAFLEELEVELAERTGPDGSVTYQRVLQLTSSVAAALHYRGSADLSLTERLFLAADRYLQGYKHVPLSVQYDRHKATEFKIFEALSPVGGFKQAQAPFERAVYNPSKLELIGVPVLSDIGIDILLRLLPYHVYALGVTRMPISADGFVRPPIDFLLHDIRHSTAIFEKRKRYESEHGLDEAASARFSKKMDLWGAELLDRVIAIEDAQFRAAVELLLFNNHHDRGFVLAPSSYLPEKPDRIARLLYKMLRLSGQSVGFSGHRKQLRAAHTWLRAFFLPKLAEEQALWGAGAQRLLPQAPG